MSAAFSRFEFDRNFKNRDTEIEIFVEIKKDVMRKVDIIDVIASSVI